ncbi:MAG: TonB-dependent receptor [Bacteroidetes bacterium]|nr:TonB-dependent receptor [Bacteroidota bacterium]
MRKFHCVLWSLLFYWCPASAQTQQVSGKILDGKDKSPLSGVTVNARGTRAAVVSGPDGSFSLPVSPKATALHFSCIGYDDQDITLSAGNQNEPLTVLLSSSQKALNEVMVVGYGKAAKRDITGSMSRLDARAVENYPAPSFESAIQGKAPGVVIQSGSGKLGQAIQVNIRGISSLSASSQPLYVVDGLPVTTTSLSDGLNEPTNPLTDINPNDIESIDILKDASAAAIYGARAANGVVLITTKKGKNSRKTLFELNTSTGISNPARTRHFLDAGQYLALARQASATDGAYDFNNDISGFPSVDSAVKWYWANDYLPAYDNFALGTDWQNAAVNTDWQGMSFHRNAASHQINLSASGGNDKTRFFISGFYNKQDAIVINNSFTRYGGRFNIDHNATDRLVFGVNLAVDRSQLNKVTNDNEFSTPGQLVAELPFAPAIDPSTGLPNPNPLYPSGIYDALYDFDHQTTYRTLGNAYANLTILPTLSFRSEVGADILSLNEFLFRGKESQDGAGVGKGQTVTAQSTSINTNNYFTYTPRIADDHRLNAVIGMSYLQNDRSQTNAQGQNYPSDAIKNLSGATNITSASTVGDRYTFLSYFLRANYSYKNRYLLTASIRTDGSSRFSSDHRYGWFPAASAGWIISEEAFMKHSPVSLLKLRASIGLTGNSEIGENQFQSLYSVTNYPNLPGFAPQQLASNRLRWERTAQADIGLEFGLWKNRVTGEVDYYHKHTTDLLLQTSIPATTGYYQFLPASTTIYENLGKMNNAGFEISVASQNLTGEFKWTTSLTLGYNKNRVGDLHGQVVTTGDGLQRAVEGQPIGSWYMQKFLGVDPANGDALYADANGKPTDDYTGQAALFTVGKYAPDYTAGLTNTVSFKGFDLSVFFYAVTGNKLFNSAGKYMSDGFANSNYDNQTTDMLNAWKTPGQKTDVPRAGLSITPDGYSFATGGGTSTRWLYDGKYIRLKNLTAGYSLPRATATALKLSSIRVYIMATNLLTWTKYPSDPEVSTLFNGTGLPSGSTSGGVDFYTIPQPRTFTLGLNVKF